MYHLATTLSLTDGGTDSQTDRQATLWCQ